jgi:26S proteasome regulatory subunit N7
MADDTVLPIPNLELPQHFFTLSTSSLAHLHQHAAEKLWAGIQADREFHNIIYLSFIGFDAMS